MKEKRLRFHATAGVVQIIFWVEGQRFHEVERLNGSVLSYWKDCEFQSRTGQFIQNRIPWLPYPCIMVGRKNYDL